MNENTSAYAHLVERINRFPHGAPPTETLYHILEVLLSEKEAALVAQLPIQPFNAEKAAQIWKLPTASAEAILTELASRALLADVECNGEAIYTLPPPMAGFFEFSMMRVHDDPDRRRVLGELFYQYCNVEEDFIQSLFADTGTPLGRVYVNEAVLQPEAYVLEYERASESIKSATHIGISHCYCRDKMETAELACAAPREICMTLNGAAESLIKYGIARGVDAAEGLDVLQLARDHNLVQIGENAREGVSFICNCCGCCCEALVAARRFESLRPMHSTNFMPQVETTTCTGCGKCVEVCPIAALALVTAKDPHHPKRKKAKVDEELCLGCGVCARVCPTHSISLASRAERVVTPLNSVHRIVLNAIERGMLQNLIVDRQVLASQRALATVLGVIFSLPPLKQILASQQVKSRYLEVLIARVSK